MNSEQTEPSADLKAEFLRCKDFMKLGQAIEHNNWQIAGMTVSRMQKNAKECGVTDFDRQFIMIKQCIANRKKTEAQNTLALVVAKRVKLMEE